MASKSQDVRPKITLACSECKERNYITKKNRRNTPDRLELAKYCPRATSRRRTARPADGFTVRAPRNEKFPGAFVCVCGITRVVPSA